MSNDTTNQFIKRGTIHISDEYLTISDPIYLNTEHDTPLWVRGWTDRTVNCFVVTGGQDGMPRSMIVTLRDVPPPELLQPELTGIFAFAALCMVDTGMAAIASGDYKSRRKSYPVGLYKDNLFVENTYLGDGMHPIAIWAENGLIHTVAVLTDRAYYDAGWR